jgi:glycosyltransferase involved in cell wall biosynthesis
MSAPVLEQLRERFPRVAVVHDWLTIPGGSEQVVLELLELFPQAELFTSIYDPSPWPAQIKERVVHSSFLNRIPGAARHYPKLLPLMNAAFRSFDLSRFDLVLSSSHACAKNVRTQPHTLHVCYCHTPMRYAWEEGFLDGEQVGRATRLLLPPLLAWLRRQDLAGASGPDVFVANSRHVAQRIQRYYRRSAEVVNPPVDVERFLGLAREPGDYYLAYGRVVPYKRVDLAVAACARLGRPLKVAGDGRALDALRALAGAGVEHAGVGVEHAGVGVEHAGAGVEHAGAGVEHAGAGVEQAGADVEFLGKASDSERDRLLSGARALLFAGEEDFGIVPVEAQAAGVPVIAYATGGAAETVLDGRTGVLFAEQSADGVVAAIERFEGLALDPAHARENAARFGRERFRAQMSDVIARAAARAGASSPQGRSS